MIGMDTNILLRVILEDDAAQSRQVRVFLEKRTALDPGYVSLITLCEFAWVLTRFYRLSRAAVADALDALLHMENIEVESAEVVQQAVASFRATQAGFSDCCIAAFGANAGSEYTFTFDKAAAKLPGMRLMPRQPA